MRGATAAFGGVGQVGLEDSEIKAREPKEDGGSLFECPAVLCAPLQVWRQPLEMLIDWSCRPPELATTL